MNRILYVAFFLSSSLYVVESLKCQITEWECQGKCIPNLEPCGTECKYGGNMFYYCNHTNTCNSYYQPCGTTCQSNKNLTYCENDGNPTCVPKTLAGTWQCDGKCQLKETPCEEKCPDSMSIANAQNNKTVCKPDWLYNLEFWSCEGANHTYLRDCEGKCLHILSSCPCSNNDFVCDKKCQSTSQQCNGQCFKDTDIPCGEKYCRPPTSNVWTCGEKCYHKSEPCNGQCPEGLSLEDGECSSASLLRQSCYLIVLVVTMVAFSLLS